MKKKQTKQGNFFEQRTFLTDLAVKVAIVLLLVYILCFCAETILPGLIISIFNFNWLLLSELGCLVFLGFLSSNLFFEKKTNVKVNFSLWFKFLFWGLLVLLAGTLFLALYRVILLQRIVYLVGVIGLLFLLNNAFKEIEIVEKDKK